MLISATVGVRVALDPVTFNVAAVSLPAPAARNEKVVEVKDRAAMAALKLATTVVVLDTFVAAFNGETAVMVGAVAVVKLKLYAAPSGTPAALVTVPAMVAV